MKIDDAVTVLNAVANEISNQEQFLTAPLFTELNKLAEAYPNDSTLLNFLNYFKKKANKEIFITKNELKEVYSCFYTPNNQFSKYLGKELGLTQEENKKVSVEISSKDFMTEAYNSIDSKLRNKIASLIEKNPAKLVSDNAKQSAERSCMYELNTLEVSPKVVEAVAFQEDLIICRAGFETPRGETSVLIPVEIKNDKALLPTMFATTAGFVDLEKNSLENFIIDNAGHKLEANANDLLKILDEIKNGKKQVLGSIEELALRATLKDGDVTLSNNGISYVPMEKASAPLPEIKYDLPEEMKSLGAQLNSVAGGAEFAFSKEAVDLARGIVIRSLESFGFKGAQVRVASFTNDKLHFAVALDGGLAFKVPVKVSKSGVKHPLIMISNGRALEFSEKGMMEVLSENKPDYKTASAASRFYENTAKELVPYLMQSLSSKDYIKSEEILTAIQNTGDVDIYNNAFDLYKSALQNGNVKTASVSGCSRQVKTASYVNPVCSHLNLPLEKVFQDEKGTCRPLHRKFEEPVEKVTLWAGRLLG